MEKLNSILAMLIAVILLFVAFRTVEAYTVTLDQVEFKSIQFRQVKQDEGGTELTLTLYAILSNADGETKAMQDAVELSPAEKTQFINFIKPKVQTACVKWDVDTPAWAQ